MTKPQNGEVVKCHFDTDGCSQSLNPNRYAYVTLRDNRKHYVSISPIGAQRKESLNDTSFDEVPPVEYTVTAKTRRRYHSVETKRRAEDVAGTTRFFDTREGSDRPIKTTVSVKLEAGSAYEISTANGSHNVPKITIRKIDSSRLNFSAAQWGWLTYRRPDLGSHENTYAVVPSTIICSPCQDY